MKLIILFLAFISPLLASPKVVVFDYGGVIANVERSPMLHFLAETLDVSYEAVKKDFARDKLYQALQLPSSFWEDYSKKTLAPDWIKQCGAKKGEIVQQVSGVKEIIERLKDQGIEVALLSNTGKYRGAFLRSMNQYSPFSTVILSCDVDTGKPNPKIYTILLETLKEAPENCLFIDNKKRNVKAAKDLGMDGIVFKSAEQLKEALQERGIDL